MTAPPGPRTPRLSPGPSGTRSGLSWNGGEMSIPVTVLPASAIRIVRVMLELEAMVAKLAGDTWPWALAPWPAEAPCALATKSLAIPVTFASPAIQELVGVRSGERLTAAIGR